MVCFVAYGSGVVHMTTNDTRPSHCCTAAAAVVAPPACNLTITFSSPVHTLPLSLSSGSSNSISTLLALMPYPFLLQHYVFSCTVLLLHTCVSTCAYLIISGESNQLLHSSFVHTPHFLFLHTNPPSPFHPHIIVSFYVFFHTARQSSTSHVSSTPQCAIFHPLVHFAPTGLYPA